MGAFLDKPKTDKVNDRGSGNGIHFGLSSMQGWRVEMEDAHCANLNVPGLKDWSFFAVFDGHAGSKVSAHCAEHLLGSILANDKFKGTNASTSPTMNNVIQGIRQGFLDLDEKMRKIPDMDSGEDKSGSTAVCCMISPSSVIFGNCGDSRGVLVRDGKVFFSTQDHKPINPVEKERIQNAGGSVMIQRVNGSLAVSRALGDFEYKNVLDKSPIEQLVSPEPEMEAIERTAQDEFIVLACDGIWDVMTNDDLAGFIHNRMLLTDNLAMICNDVVDTCLYKGSRDNMSIIIVSLDGAPKVSAEAIKKEDELNARLENRVKEIADTEEADLPYVMHILSSEQIDGLPPGGGLPAKYVVNEALVSEKSQTSFNFRTYPTTAMPPSGTFLAPASIYTKFFKGSTFMFTT